jgi:hypothetical protein
MATYRIALGFVLATASVAQAGAVLELTALTPPNATDGVSYLPGTVVDFSVSISTDRGVDTGVRLMHIGFHDSDPALAFLGPDEWDGTNPGSDGIPEFVWDFSTLVVDALYSKNLNYPAPRVTYQASEPHPGFILVIPAEASLLLGTGQVRVPDASGEYLLDALNESDDNYSCCTARLDFGFDDPTTWTAHGGEITGGRLTLQVSSRDCNGNGVPDELDIANGTSEDCNANQVPDECDVADGTSGDCTGNEIPDECEPDCNENEVADSCDIAFGGWEDCNDNGIPDGCDVLTTFTAGSDELGPFAYGWSQSFTIASPPPAVGVVILSLVARADLNGTGEWVHVDVNGVSMGAVFVDGGSQCGDSTDMLLIPGTEYNAIVGGGPAVITMDPTSNVDAHICDDSWIAVDVEYQTHGPNDTNANGIPDECEPLMMVSSNPPTGAIDARQPFNVSGSNPTGWDSVEITLNVDPLGLTAADFAVTEEGGDGVAPEIADITFVGPNTIRLSFGEIIETRAWTTITHSDSGTSTRLGYLPGDVNGSGTTGPSDILALIDALNGARSLPEYSTDIDRSGSTAPADILREIDLLNGAGAYPVYLDASLP